MSDGTLDRGKVDAPTSSAMAVRMVLTLEGDVASP
jgi:hypothetical protein